MAAPAPQIEFTNAVVGRTDDKRVMIALMDGDPRTCLGVLLCTAETARALVANLGSVLDAPAPP
jgi:hypothetical protein